jgi:hypothetical protein
MEVLLLYGVAVAVGVGVPGVAVSVAAVEVDAGVATVFPGNTRSSPHAAASSVKTTIRKSAIRVRISVLACVTDRARTPVGRGTVVVAVEPTTIA